MSTTSENNVVEEEAESRNATAEVDSRNGAAPSPTDGVARIHQLQNTWTLWFYKSDNSRKWEDNLREVIKFDTVEDFWGLFNHIIPPSSLVTGCDYCLFKSGIRPMWEDPRNQQGGRWVISLDKRERDAYLNSHWLELLLLLIGEACADELADAMCGAVVNVRARGDKIALWLAIGSAKATEKHKEQVIAIGEMLRERLQLPDTASLHFEAHQGNNISITLPPRAK